MVDAFFIPGEIRAILLYFLERKDDCIHGAVEFIFEER